MWYTKSALYSISKGPSVTKPTNMTYLSVLDITNSLKKNKKIKLNRQYFSKSTLKHTTFLNYMVCPLQPTFSFQNSLDKVSKVTLEP